jgi:hypothetical protein
MVKRKIPADARRKKPAVVHFAARLFTERSVAVVCGQRSSLPFRGPGFNTTADTNIKIKIIFQYNEDGSLLGCSAV